jgi:hypothetical protein
MSFRVRSFAALMATPAEKTERKGEGILAKEAGSKAKSR